MAYDLRREHWIPWRRRSGTVEWGPPAALLDGLDDDPVVALASPRADFDAALREFLIGLLSAALLPADESAWLELWMHPPAREELQASLDALPPAFFLDGDGARFFQDHSAGELADARLIAIDQILIDAAGDQGARLNKDLFVKRGRVDALGRPAAAMALLTLQTYAPAGGQGHRTSLRGGGPLTTLIDPRSLSRSGRARSDALWSMLWANAETVSQWVARRPSRSTSLDAADVFPWLAPTRTSNPKGGRETTPSDAHPLQAYFGLPRRIRLEFGGEGRCDLTGAPDERTVTGFRMINYGVQYVGWRHPLSPYYRAKADGELLPVHGQPGGVAWRDWLGLTLRIPEGETREPAAVVVAFNDRARHAGASVVRLHAYGYDMDNMKARGWTDAALPSFATDDRERRLLLGNAAARLTAAGRVAATALLDAVKSALFDAPDRSAGDLSEVKAQLWADTETAFFDAMRRVAAPESTVDTVSDVCREFAQTLSAACTGLFDRWCDIGGTDPEALRRFVGARLALVRTLAGHSKAGRQLHAALGMAAPEDSRGGRGKKPRKPKEVQA